MLSFRDAQGDAWDIAINVGSLETIKGRTKINLWDEFAAGLEQFSRTLADPFAAASILHALCSAQAEARGLSPEQFFARLDGAALGAASEGLAQELLDFFQQARGLTGLRESWDKLVQANRSIFSKMNEAIQMETTRLDPSVAASQMLADARGQNTKRTPGPWPAARESTPDPSRSGSFNGSPMEPVANAGNAPPSAPGGGSS